MKNENADVNSGHEQETEGQSHPAIGIKTEDNTASSVNPTTAANQRQEYNLETDERRQYVANLEEQCNTLRCNLMNEQFQVQELNNELEVEQILHHENLMREQQSHQKTYVTLSSSIHKARKAELELLSLVLEQDDEDEDPVQDGTVPTRERVPLDDLRSILYSMNSRLTDMRELVPELQDSTPSTAQTLVELIRHVHRNQSMSSKNNNDGSSRIDTYLDRKFLAKAITDTNKELIELQDKYMLAGDTRSDGSTIPAALFHAKIEDSVMTTDDHSTIRTTTCSSSRKRACVDGVSITP